jgi:hypothetical protein
VRAGRVVVRLVRDDGEVFARGDRVSLGRTRTSPPEWHAAKTASGPYEVIGCSTVPSGPGHLLQLVLRVIDPA